jgi:hypothetical protein
VELNFLLALHDWQPCALKDEVKKKHAEEHEVGSTQTPSGGERVEFMVCPQELQTGSCTECYVHVRSKMAIHSPLNAKSPKTVKL